MPHKGSEPVCGGTLSDVILANINTKWPSLLSLAVRRRKGSGQRQRPNLSEPVNFILYLIRAMRQVQAFYTKFSPRS